MSPPRTGIIDSRITGATPIRVVSAEANDVFLSINQVRLDSGWVLYARVEVGPDGELQPFLEASRK